MEYHPKTYITRRTGEKSWTKSGLGGHYINIMNKEYKLNPTDFSKFRNNLIFKVLPLIFISAAAGIIMAREELNISIILMNLLIMIPVLIFSLYKSIKNQKRVYLSYYVRFNEDNISAYLPNHKEEIIKYNDISKIEEYKNGRMLIRSRTGSKINVPIQIEARDSLKNELLKYSPIFFIESNYILRPLFLNCLAAALMLGLMLSFCLIDNQLFVLISGIILIIAIIFCEIFIFLSKKIDKKLKFTSLLTIGVIFFAINRILIFY
jgi:hypothetical protein